MKNWNKIYFKPLLGLIGIANNEKIDTWKSGQDKARDGYDPKNNTNVSVVQEYMENLHCDTKRMKRLKYIRYFIVMPILFVVVNGLFVFLASLTGIFEEIKILAETKTALPITWYIMVILFGFAYIAYLFGAITGLIKLTKTKGMGFLSGDEE